jgi:hypothetical protein
LIWLNGASGCLPAVAMPFRAGGYQVPQPRKNPLSVGNPTWGLAFFVADAWHWRSAFGEGRFRAGNGEGPMMWLALAAVSLALAIGSTVLAVSVQGPGRYG